MDKKILIDIRFVLKEQYDKLNNEERIGVLFFVRNNNEDVKGDIYFGNRYYGSSRGDALTKSYVDNLFDRVNVDSDLSFYCIEPVNIIINDEV